MRARCEESARKILIKKNKRVINASAKVDNNIGGELLLLCLRDLATINQKYFFIIIRQYMASERGNCDTWKDRDGLKQCWSMGKSRIAFFHSWSTKINFSTCVCASWGFHSQTFFLSKAVLLVNLTTNLRFNTKRLWKSTDKMFWDKNSII